MNKVSIIQIKAILKHYLKRARKAYYSDVQDMCEGLGMAKVCQEIAVLIGDEKLATDFAKIISMLTKKIKESFPVGVL